LTACAERPILSEKKSLFLSHFPKELRMLFQLLLILCLCVTSAWGALVPRTLVFQDGQEEYSIHIDDLERHIFEHYGHPLCLKFNEIKQLNGDATLLVIQDVELIFQDGHYFIEGTVSRKSWNIQRKVLQDLKDSFRIKSIVAIAASALPVGYLGYLVGPDTMFGGRRNIPIWEVYGAGASHLFLFGGIAYALNRLSAYYSALMHTMKPIIQDATRIVGFRKIGEEQDTIRIRTDFPVDSIAHYPEQESYYQAFRKLVANLMMKITA
jgi:hypothetical protein